MKRVLPIAIFLTLGAIKSNAQVLIDKQVQMNGSTENDKRVTGLSTPQHLTDATNADAILHNKLNYTVATGSANNFDLKLLLSPEGYKAGLVINFKSNQDITGEITINVNGIGPKPVFKNLSENLIAGDIKNGQVLSVIYDGVAFQVLSQLAQAANFSGSLLGEVTGTQKNTFIEPGVITTSKIANDAVVTSKILDANITTVKIADDAIITSKIADGSVTTAKVADGGITTAKIADANVTTEKIADVSISAAKIQNNAIITSKIADNAVTTFKISDLNVTTEKLDDDAVTNSKISNLSVTTGKIADANVTTVKIADNAVMTSKIADNAINTAKIIDENVTTAKIANAAVTDAKVASGISYSKLSGAPTSLPPTGAAGGDLSGTYPNPVIGTGSINSAKIADGSITNADINASAAINYTKLNLTNSIANTDLTANSITTSKVADGTVTTAKIIDGAVTTAKIADGTITNADIDATAAISYSKLALTNSITNGDLIANSVTTSKVADGTVTSAKIFDGAVTTAKIADGTITNADIDATAAIAYSKLALTNSIGNGDLTANSVTTSKVADGTVTSAKIFDGTIQNADVAPSAAIAYSKLVLTNSIGNGDLTANSVTTSKVADGTVTTSKMADSAISGLKLLTGAVGPIHISTLGAASGQVLGYNGSNVTWTTPSGAPTGAAGGSLTGTYPNPTIASGAIGNAEIANNAVTTSKVANGTVTTSKMADSAISGLKLLTGAVGPKHISTIGAASGQFLGYDGTNITWTTPSASVAAGSITNTEISSSAAIAYSKLALTNSIVNGDITANSITTSKVANGTVTTSKMADSAISGLKLLTGAVGPKHISTIGASSGQVLGYDGTNIGWTTPSASVAAGSITNTEISSSAAIAYSKLALTNSIVNGDITANSITTSKVADGTVTSAKIFDGTIVNADVAPSAAIAYTKLALTNSIVSSDLTNASITTAKISSAGASTGQVLGYDGTNIGWTTPSASVAAGSITNTEISSSAAIAYSKLALTNKIVNGDLTASSITTSKVADGTVTSAKIFDGTIVNADVAPSAAIAYTKLALANSIVSNDLTNGSVTTAKISSAGASTGQVLGYNGSNIAWVTPSGSTSGTSVTNATVGGTTNITITDPNTRYIIVSFAGSNAGTSSLNVTLPAASSYPAGAIIWLVPTSYITANPTWTITSPSSTYNALNNNGVSMGSGVSIGAVNNHKMVTDGVSNWYKLP